MNSLIFFVLIWSLNSSLATPSICTPLYCQNGGKCIEIGINLAYCACINGYSGNICNIPPEQTTTHQISTTTGNLCFEGVCKNNGKCVLIGSSAYCECAQGYSGVFCEEKESTTTSEPELTPCSSNPCLNNGVCVSQSDFFRCNCPATYTGIVCESRYKFCEVSPCKNGSKCIETGEYDGKCECLSEEYFGMYCDTKFCDEESKKTCKNGTCLEINGKINCLEFSG